MKNSLALLVLPLALLALEGVKTTPGKTDRTAVVCRAELDKPVLPADETNRAVIKITLDAEQVPTGNKRPPINLSVVLDRSGSMAGQKLEHAKAAAIAALRRLDSQDIFSLVAYSTAVETIIPAQAAVNTEDLERRIQAIGSSGNTNLFGGVNQGASEVRRHLADKRYTPRIILLSDGLANVGPSSPEELGRLGAALVKEGISVTTVGVGDDYNEDLMTQLSQKSDGNTYFVEASQDLPRIFAAELGDVLSVVARKVTIEITCPHGIRPIRIIGRDGRLSGQQAEVFLNQLYGGQSKYVLLEVEVPPTVADHTRQLAAARCTYESALDNASRESRTLIAATFTSDRQEVVAKVNKPVQSDVAATYNAILVNEVVEMTDQGETKKAVEALRQRSQDLRMEAATFSNSSLTTQSAELEEQAVKLEKAGMDKSMRKYLRSDSYQTINQQSNR